MISRRVQAIIESAAQLQVEQRTRRFSHFLLLFLIFRAEFLKLNVENAFAGAWQQLGALAFL